MRERERGKQTRERWSLCDWLVSGARARRKGSNKGENKSQEELQEKENNKRAGGGSCRCEGEEAQLDKAQVGLPPLGRF